MMAIDWARFVEIVRGAQRFVLTSHVRPDCDALGSELGMAGVLRALGKEVRIVNAQATPPNLRFIDTERRILTLGVDVSAADLLDDDVLLVLDTSAWAQLGAMGEVLRTTRARKLVLDHHVSEDDLGAENFKDASAEATGRLVFEAATQLGVALDEPIAAPLFAALATDTGWFRFGSTTPGTFRCGAELVAAGARPAQLYQSLYEQYTLARLRLLGRILASARTEEEGRLIHTSVVEADFRETGALHSDTEDIVNMTLWVADTEVALIFVEQGEGSLKISFRSRSSVDARLLAEQFGGGGHRAAAGATVTGALDEVRARVLDAVRAAMR
jgi:bifunctional oligoribonuclease and PAP phosphatase NrnA